MKILENKLLKQIKNFEGEVGLALKVINTNEKIIINDRIFLAASTIKIPLVLSLFSKIQNSELEYYDDILISESDFVEDSPHISTLKLPVKMSIADLIKWTIVVSDNTTTNVLINLSEINFINELLKNWGFKHTTLNRKMMDLKARKNGIDNWTTPLEMIILLEKILNNEILSEKYSQEFFKVFENQQDNEKIPSGIPKNIKVINKPGELPGTRSDVGIVFARNPFILSVFCDRLKIDEIADEFIAGITREIYNHLN